MTRSLAAACVIILVASMGCSDPTVEQSSAAPSTTRPEKLVVMTVNYPLQYFAERIGGDLVDVRFPAPADVDPAYWSPQPEIIAEYQSADLVLLNGADYAKWLSRATLPASILVDTSAALKDRLIPLEAGPVHSHGPEGEHSHTGYAFTTWLDPTLALEQARAVAAALVTKRPESEETFQAGLTDLEADLMAFDAEQEVALAGLEGQSLIFSHPVYQYLIGRYGLTARSVHWEPDETPGEDQWHELETSLTEQPAGSMVWEGEPTAETSQRLSGLGIDSVVYEAAANVPHEGDFMAVMRRNIEALQSLAK